MKCCLCHSSWRFGVRSVLSVRPGTSLHDDEVPGGNLLFEVSKPNPPPALVSE